MYAILEFCIECNTVFSTIQVCVPKPLDRSNKIFQTLNYAVWCGWNNLAAVLRIMLVPIYQHSPQIGVLIERVL